LKGAVKIGNRWAITMRARLVEMCRKRHKPFAFLLSAFVRDTLTQNFGFGIDDNNGDQEITHRRRTLCFERRRPISPPRFRPRRCPGAGCR